MVGIDTNVLVRHMVQDDAKQAKLATDLTENGCSQENPASIPLIVLCETVWVLGSAYGYAREQIAMALRQILLTETFDIEAHDIAWNALSDYQEGKADFADGVITRLNRMRGCDTTFTFDKKAARLPGFSLLGK